MVNAQFSLIWTNFNNEGRHQRPTPGLPSLVAKCVIAKCITALVFRCLFLRKDHTKTWRWYSFSEETSPLPSALLKFVVPTALAPLPPPQGGTVPTSVTCPQQTMMSEPRPRFRPISEAGPWGFEDAHARCHGDGKVNEALRGIMRWLTLSSFTTYPCLLRKNGQYTACRGHFMLSYGTRFSSLVLRVFKRCQGKEGQFNTIWIRQIPSFVPMISYQANRCLGRTGLPSIYGLAPTLSPPRTLQNASMDVSRDHASILNNPTSQIPVDPVKLGEDSRLLWWLHAEQSIT